MVLPGKQQLRVERALDLESDATQVVFTKRSNILSRSNVLLPFTTKS